MDAERANTLLRRYTEIVRSTYCELRNRWHSLHERRETNWGAQVVPKYDGGTGPGGQKYKSVWDRVARFVIQNSAEPRRFVQVQFAVRQAKPIEPTELVSPRALELYRYNEKTAFEDILRLFHYQQQRAATEFNKLRPCKINHQWTDADIHRAVLGNTLVQLSALFRYCIAHREGYTSIADRYKDEALVQYLSQPEDYDKIWVGWIPPELTNEAQLLYLLASPASSMAVAEEPEEQRPSRAIIKD